MSWVRPPGPADPSPDLPKFNWTESRVDFAEKHGMEVEAHHLAWGSPEAVREWLREGGYGPDEAIAILGNHVRTTVEHFRGRVHRWSAVNEPFEADGSCKTGPSRWGWWNDNSPWSDGIDPDYIEVAFREAHAADPAAILLLNEYDAEFLNAKSDAVYNLVARLKQKELPIHGVGMQMHFPASAGFPDTAALTANMRRFHDELGVQVYITEMSVDMRGLGATIDERFAAQAEFYRAIIQACIESGACWSMCVFGVADNELNVYLAIRRAMSFCSTTLASRSQPTMRSGRNSRSCLTSRKNLNPWRAYGLIPGG